MSGLGSLPLRRHRLKQLRRWQSSFTVDTQPACFLNLCTPPAPLPRRKYGNRECKQVRPQVEGAISTEGAPFPPPPPADGQKSPSSADMLFWKTTRRSCDISAPAAHPSLREDMGGSSLQPTQVTEVTLKTEYGLALWALSQGMEETLA